MQYYKVHAPFSISEDQLESLVLLYQPLFSFPSMSLYLSLHGLSKVQTMVSLRDLMKRLHTDSDNLIVLRKELEQMGLLRSFNNEVFEIILLPPLTPREFLSHDVYARLFSIVLGQQVFALYCEKYKQQEAVNLECEVTQVFDIQRIESWNINDETLFHQQSEESLLKYQFDAKTFFRDFALFPNHLVDAKVLRLVSEYGSFYKVSQSEMKSLLLDTIRFNSNVFDEKRFLKLVAQKQGQETLEAGANVYELDPVSFLRHHQGFEVSQRDRGVLKAIVSNYDFSNDVINVLVEEMLRSGNSISVNFAASIADPWKRQGVKTFEDAKKALDSYKTYLEKPKETKRIQARKEVIQPVYTDPENLNETSDELERLRQELGIIGNKGDS